MQQIHSYHCLSGVLSTWLQGYELRENLRIQLTKDKRISEHDVVVKGKDKAYIGSHKALAKGAK